MSLEEIIGEGPHTSLWTSSSGVREVDKDMKKGNFVIFAFKQLMELQVEIEEDIDRPMRDKIELKCHNDESSCFVGKLKYLECMIDVDRVEWLGICRDHWCFHQHRVFTSDFILNEELVSIKNKNKVIMSRQNLWTNNRFPHAQDVYAKALFYQILTNCA